MVVVGMDRRDDWDDDVEDRTYNPRTTGVRDLLSYRLVTLLLCRCDRDNRLQRLGGEATINRHFSLRRQRRLRRRSSSLPAARCLRGWNTLQVTSRR